MLKHSRDERVLVAPALIEFGTAIDSRIDCSTQLPGCLFERLEELSMGQVVTDDEQIDVAVGRIAPFGNRPVDEGQCNPAGQRCKRRAKHIDQPDRLYDQPAQLVKDRAFRVGLVVLLPPDLLDGDDTRIRQPPELAKDRAGARTGQADNLVGIEAARGIAEQNAQHALLNAIEQGIGNAAARRNVPNLFRISYNTHIGNDSTHYGIFQSCMRMSASVVGRGYIPTDDTSALNPSIYMCPIAAKSHVAIDSPTAGGDTARMTQDNPQDQPAEWRELAEFKQQFRQFVAERDWAQFHSPKNLSMALAGEAGELLELFQWLTQDESRNLPDDARQAVAHEIADIQIYLAAISDRLGIDIGPAVAEKMKLNAEKYPADLARGTALKYSKLKR